MTLKATLGRTTLGVVVLVLLVAAAAWAFQRQARADIAGDAPQAMLPITSSSFTDGERMPQKLTCDGPNESPDIQWSTPPGDTKSYAIVMDDTDAPLGFTHWLAYNISGDTRGLPEAASTPSKRLDQAAEGTNSFGNLGYGGPCPPAGKPHHYVFHVYALNVNPGLPAGQTKEQLATAVQGHVLAEGTIVGLYGHGG